MHGEQDLLQHALQCVGGSKAFECAVFGNTSLFSAAVTEISWLPLIVRSHLVV